MRDERQLSLENRDRPEPPAAEEPGGPDPVDETDEESFPASDPPARTPITGVGGGPRKQAAGQI